jgi:hypothetical protein
MMKVKNVFILLIVLLNLVFGNNIIEDIINGIKELISSMLGLQPPQFSNPSILPEVISTCLIIVLTEVSVLGIVYALGKAFSYNRLVTYSRGEFTQALANLVLIGIISFAFTLTNIPEILTSIYTKIGEYSLKVLWYSWWIIAYNSAVNLLMAVSASARVEFPLPPPLSFVIIILGIDNIQLFEGLAPLFDVVDRIYSFFSASWIFLAATKVFLYLIGSNLFLILLYLGLILRAIPWGRSAGGYLIAIFISFYFFYPLFLSYLLSLEPFENIELSPTKATDWVTTVKNGFSAGGIPGLIINTVLGLMENSIYAFANFAIKYLISILLCFIMTIMLAEEIGAVLGTDIRMDKVLKLFNV